MPGWKGFLASVDVGIGLLGYGTVGSSVDRMLVESAEEIERATGHRLRVVRALVRDPKKERPFPAGDGVLTSDFAAIRDDPEVQIVAEVMGGLSPAGDYVRELLRAGKPVVSANKQLIARDGAELFAAASEAGVQLALRGVGMRGDSRREGAARIARRHERPPRARHRQRDDELHALEHGARRRRTPRRSPRRRRSGTRRRIRPTT